MALIVNSDLTGLQSFPQVEDFVLDVPLAGLVALWRPGIRITESGGAVSEWEALPEGYSALQSVSGVQPAVSSGIIVPDGVDDYLSTDLPPPTSGYLVAKVIAKTTSGTCFVGSQLSSSNGGHRCALGVNTSMKAAFQIGSTTFSTFAGTTTLVADSEYVIGGLWNAGTCKLRVNGAQENSTTYNGSGGSPGTLEFAFGARNRGTLRDLFSPFNIKAVAVYSGASPDVAAIDAAMAAF